jgi:hypothetical protein
MHNKRKLALKPYILMALTVLAFAVLGKLSSLQALHWDSVSGFML